MKSEEYKDAAIFLLFHSHEWQSAYQESIKKHGSVSITVTRSIFVGPPEAGKSSLKHLLVHNTPKEVKTSTAVMDTPEVVSISSEQYTVGETTSAWQLVDSDVMKKALHACIASQAYEEKDQYPAEVETEETEDGQHEAVVEEQMDARPLPKRSKIERDQSDPIASLDEKCSQLLERMGGEGKQIELKDASFIHLLDTGGQPSFQDVLPLLLDVPCTYVHVFNAAHSLDKRVPITYRSYDHPTVPLEDAEPGRDMMQRSFSSMLTMAQKCSRQLDSFRQDSLAPQLRIFVVGTRKDQLIKEDRLDKATQDITTFLDGLNGKPYYHSIEWDSSTGNQFFLIDTMADEADKDNRACVENLRGCLSSKGSSLKLDVPVVWFFCQEITRCTEKKFFRLQDLEAFCRRKKFVDGENAANQFRALLQLFSLLSFYSFFSLEDVGRDDKDNFVCTDTGVFLREVSKLLAVQFMKSKGSGMATFKKTGILSYTPKLFQELEMSREMDPRWFLDALQHLGIAARLPYKDPLQYFIPAALPQSSEIQDPPSSVAPLCFTYIIKEGVHSFSDMPRGVFCRLAVELIRQTWVIAEYESSRSLLKFPNARDKFVIFLKECPGYISLVPQAMIELPSPLDLRTACKSLLETVTECLTTSTEDVVGSQFSGTATLAKGFRCQCEKKNMPHLAIPSKQGDLLECTRKCDPQTYSNQQRIWFSPVDGVELKRHPDGKIWVLDDCIRSEELATSSNGSVRGSVFLGCCRSTSIERTTPPQPTPPQPTPPQSKAKQVLSQFRSRFIDYMDANAVVHELEHQKIIMGGDKTTIMRTPDTTQQNEYLHACLLRTCDEKALMAVCDIIVQRGYPTMKTLGQDMKSRLDDLLRGAVST